MFLFLIVNLFQKKKDILLLLVLSVFSGFLAVIFGIFQLFEKFFIPFNFAQTNSFNTVGAVNGLAVFSAVLLPLTICFIFNYSKIKPIELNQTIFWNTRFTICKLKTELF